LRTIRNSRGIKAGRGFLKGGKTRHSGETGRIKSTMMIKRHVPEKTWRTSVRWGRFINSFIYHKQDQEDVEGGRNLEKLRERKKVPLRQEKSPGL